MLDGGTQLGFELIGGTQPELISGTQPDLSGGTQLELSGGTQPDLSGGTQPDLSGDIIPHHRHSIDWASPPKGINQLQPPQPQLPTTVQEVQLKLGLGRLEQRFQEWQERQLEQFHKYQQQLQQLQQQLHVLEVTSSIFARYSSLFSPPPPLSSPLLLFHIH
jgi:hypothetical protein